MPEGEARDHLPVMVGEVIRILTDGGVDLLVDGTVGAGGHSAGFLEERGADARVIGIDRDPEMLERARARLEPYGDRVTLCAGSYADIEAILDREGIARVDGVLLDVGASSVHFDDSSRGFSFRSPGPLDMRFDRKAGGTAADLIDGMSEAEMAEVFRKYGDESRAGRIAAAIVRERPVRDTLRLAEIVERAVGGRGRIHPATKVFQALRVFLNDELGHLARGIGAAFSRLRDGGRLVVISFHSGEDRVVKSEFRARAREGLGRLLTDRPLRPGRHETQGNPRARSARLRACERVRGAGV